MTKARRRRPTTPETPFDPKHWYEDFMAQLAADTARLREDYAALKRRRRERRPR